MFLVILGIAYIVFSLMCRKKYNPNWGLLFILFAMGLQANVPGDYDRYEFAYNEIAANRIDFRNLRSEIGWGYTNYFLSPFLPFKLFIFFLSLLEVCILAKFIKNYTDKKFMFLSGLIFYFSLNMMLFQMKGLRQGLAIELCLLALMSADKLKGMRRIIWPIFIILLASKIHTSALLMLPVTGTWILFRKYFSIKRKIRKFNLQLPFIITGIYIFIFIQKSVLIDANMGILLSLNLQGQEGYFGQLKSVDYNLLITIYGVIMVFAVTAVMQYQSGIRRYLSIIVIISLFIEMITFGAGDLYRLSLYYGICQIVVFPNVASFLYRKRLHKLSWLFSGLVVSYNFRTFITQTIRHSVDGFDNYEFIIFKFLE